MRDQRDPTAFGKALIEMVEMRADCPTVRVAQDIHERIGLSVPDHVDPDPLTKYGDPRQP